MVRLATLATGAPIRSFVTQNACMLASAKMPVQNEMDSSCRRSRHSGTARRGEMLASMCLQRGWGEKEFQVGREGLRDKALEGKGASRRGARAPTRALVGLPRRELLCPGGGEAIAHLTTIIAWGAAPDEGVIESGVAVASRSVRWPLSASARSGGVAGERMCARWCRGTGEPSLAFALS
ncbi:MAG: hypothetical protein CMH65_02320 [Nevskiales bacterium]|nr:hypothetical protein [Nevskiales bacterium]